VRTQAGRGLGGARPGVAGQLAMFTVDVEPDWGEQGARGVHEVLPRLVELLRERSATATFFVVGDIADEVTGILAPDGPDEVASHSQTHPLLTRLTEAEVEAEVVGSRRRLRSLGYEVDGFRAPYNRVPASLPAILRDAGYRYDASAGPVLPGRRRGAPPPVSRGPDGLDRVSAGLLRDRVTPCTLTWLRMGHPWSLALIPARPTAFACHPHELLIGTDGWSRLPSPLRRLHRRGTGAQAWAVVERLLSRPGVRFVSCREYLHAPAA
jgi:peptidoglycan/xylan/chitin deacetylase (PgdA/CDA1 family)